MPKAKARPNRTPFDVSHLVAEAAERQVLAGVIDILDRDTAAARDIIAGLAVEMFHGDGTGDVFKAARDALSSVATPTVADVLTALRHAGSQQGTAGHSLLVDLVNDRIGTGPQAARLAREAATEVRQLYERQQAVRAAAMVVNGNGHPDDVRVLVRNLERLQDGARPTGLAAICPIPVPSLEHQTSVQGLTASFVGPPGTMTARLQIVGSDGNLLDVQDVKLSDQRRRTETADHVARLLGADAVAVERALVGLAAKRCHPPAVTSGAVTLSTCLVDWLERQDSETLPTRLEPFDFATGGGLPLGAVTLFAAPPGIGKTAMALQLAIGAMTHDPAVRCVWALGEMTRRAFSRRVAVVSATMLGHGALTTRDAKDRTDHARRVALSVEKSIGTRLAVIDGDVSIERVAVAARETGARLIVLDYLQRLTTTTASQDRTTEIETIARKALELAVGLDAAVVLLAATAKLGGAGVGADQLARGSGSPGFDAEFAYLGEAPPPEERGARYPVKWRCRKARSESMSDIDLEFDGPTQTYLPVTAPEFADFARFSPGVPR
jgi:replicative DNA helicase